MLKKITKQIVLIYIEKFHSSILNYQNKYVSVMRCYHAQVGSGYDKVLRFGFFYPWIFYCWRRMAVVAISGNRDLNIFFLILAFPGSGSN